MPNDEPRGMKKYKLRGTNTGEEEKLSPLEISMHNKNVVNERELRFRVYQPVVRKRLKNLIADEYLASYIRK